MLVKTNMLQKDKRRIIWTFLLFSESVLMRNIFLILSVLNIDTSRLHTISHTAALLHCLWPHKRSSNSVAFSWTYLNCQQGMPSSVLYHPFSSVSINLFHFNHIRLDTLVSLGRYFRHIQLGRDPRAVPGDHISHLAWGHLGIPP